MDENTKELVDVAQDIFSEGIQVSISRKDAAMLFGAVIAANVATLFVLSGITRLAKRVVKKMEPTDTTEQDLRDAIEHQEHEYQAKHLKAVEE